MQRTFKYRLYPNRKQRETLTLQLDLCRELYNAALQERIESYKTTQKGVTWLQQQSQLPAIKEVRPEFKSINAHTLQAVLIRLNRSFQNFFRRVFTGGSEHVSLHSLLFGFGRHYAFCAISWTSNSLAASEATSHPGKQQV